MQGSARNRYEKSVRARHALLQCYILGRHDKAGTRLGRLDRSGQDYQYGVIAIQVSRPSSSLQLISLTIRPPSVALPNFDPRHLLSTVDGSAFLSTYKDGEEVRLRGHMSTSFGQQDALDGHALDIVLSPSTDIAVFAPASSGRMVLVYLDPEAQTIRSTRLIISNEDAQDQLLPNRRTRSTPISAGSTLSPLLGVFDDMWTRFPVVAAIERDNLDASTRVKPALTLVEPTSGAIKVSEFQAHWNMVVTVSHSLGYYIFSADSPGLQKANQ